jgi:hypothetical protein
MASEILIKNNEACIRTKGNLAETWKSGIAGAVDHLVGGVEKAENSFAVIHAAQENQEPDVILDLKKTASKLYLRSYIN